MAQAAGDVLGLGEHDGADVVGVGEVFAEGLLVADGFGLALGDDRAVVDAGSMATGVYYYRIEVTDPSTGHARSSARTTAPRSA